MERSVDGDAGERALSQPRALGRRATALFEWLWIAGLLVTLDAHVRGTLIWLGGAPLHALVWLQAAFWLLPTVVPTAIAIALFRVGRRDLPTALMSSSLLAVGATNLMPVSYWEQATGGLFIEAVSHAASLGLFYAFLLFPDGRFASRQTKYFAAFLAIYTAADMLRVLFELKGKLLGLQATISAPLLLAATIAFVTARLRRTGERIERQRLRAIRVGLAFGAVLLGVGFLMFYLEPRLNPVGRLAVASFGAAVLLALGFAALGLAFLAARQSWRLFQLEVLITSPAGIGTLSLAFLGLLGSVQEVLRAELAPLTGSAGMAQALTIMIGAVIIAPLTDIVRRWRESSVRGRLSGLRDGLPEALAELRDVATVPELLREAASRIESAVRPVRLALFAGATVELEGVSPESLSAWRAATALDRVCGPIDIASDDPLFPFRMPIRLVNGGEPLGWLLLGTRPDGTCYGGAELAALERVGEPLARAIRTVELRERDEARHAELTAAAARR